MLSLEHIRTKIYVVKLAKQTHTNNSSFNALHLHAYRKLRKKATHIKW